MAGINREPVEVFRLGSGDIRGRRGWRVGAAASLVLAVIGIGIPAGAQTGPAGSSKTVHGVSTKSAPVTVHFSAASGTFKMVPGTPAPDRVTLAGLSPEATLKAPGEPQVTVPVASAVRLLEASGTTEAVVRVPGAPANQDAIAVDVSKVSTDAQGDVSAMGRPEQKVKQPQLKSEAAGLDTNLPATFPMANVSARPLPQGITCDGAGTFKCTFNTEISKFGVRGEQVKCPVYVFAEGAGGSNQGTIYTKPWAYTQAPTDSAVKVDYTETDTVAWGHAFSRLVSKVLLTFHADPYDPSKTPYKVEAAVWCTDTQVGAWVVASVLP